MKIYFENRSAQKINLTENQRYRANPSLAIQRNFFKINKSGQNSLNPISIKYNTIQPSLTYLKESEIIRKKYNESSVNMIKLSDLSDIDNGAKVVSLLDTQTISVYLMNHKEFKQEKKHLIEKISVFITQLINQSIISMHNSVLNYHIEIVDSNTSVVIEDNSDRQMYSKIFYINSTYDLEYVLTQELKQDILEILEDYFDINEKNPFLFKLIDEVFESYHSLTFLFEILFKSFFEYTNINHIQSVQRELHKNFTIDEENFKEYTNIDTTIYFSNIVSDLNRAKKIPIHARQNLYFNKDANLLLVNFIADNNSEEFIRYTFFLTHVAYNRNDICFYIKDAYDTVDRNLLEKDFMFMLPKI